MPYVLDGDGNCHMYIDRAADLSMAHDLAVNAKTHRFGVCNAVETILVHRAGGRRAAAAAGRARWARPGSRSGATSGCARLLPSATPATEDDFASEFLAPVVAMAVVDDVGGGHRTTSPVTARVTPRRS